MYISKEDSVIHRGIAILIMIYGHLFFADNTDLCTNYLHLNGEPLAKFFTYACNPVPYFLIISGYGYSVLFSSGNSNKINWKSQLVRVLKLYKYYWLILSCFLIIGFLFNYRSQFVILEFVLNYTGVQTSYIGATWFLLPFSCLILLAKPIFKFVEKIGVVRFWVISLLLWVLTYYFLTVREYNGIFRFVLLSLGFLYAFAWGIVFHRTIGEKKLNNIIAILLVACCFLVAGFFQRQFAFILPFVLFFLLAQIKWPKFMRTFLLKVGGKSMPMWMIHTIFCSYYFREQLYAIKYPPLIFIALVAISYVCAVGVDELFNVFSQFKMNNHHVFKQES